MGENNNVISARTLGVPQQWEYLQYAKKHILRSVDDVNTLAEFGQQGWELVSVVAVPVRNGYELRYTFKRPVPRPPR